MTWLTNTTMQRKAVLATLLESPMTHLAARCSTVWTDAYALDRYLADGLHKIPHCALLYALSVDGVQISSNVTPTGTEQRWQGQNLSQRPYLKTLPYKGFLLSRAYLSRISNRPCITAVQAVLRDGALFGFIAADFMLSDLDLPGEPTRGKDSWRQFRGDPAIRAQVFAQQRVHSSMDEHMDDAIIMLSSLIREHGVFYSVLHFSSARAMLWMMDDPYRYVLHAVEEIINPDLCLAYARRTYPAEATTTADQVDTVLSYFKALRLADENIYLRSGSLNIMNGMVGLTFSCDGTYYMPVAEFIARDIGFWTGSVLENTPTLNPAEVA
jgi:hypothetical protein